MSLMNCHDFFIEAERLSPPLHLPPFSEETLLQFPFSKMRDGLSRQFPRTFHRRRNNPLQTVSRYSCEDVATIWRVLKFNATITVVQNPS
jgi:hypothetical protein